MNEMKIHIKKGILFFWAIRFVSYRILTYSQTFAKQKLSSDFLFLERTLKGGNLPMSACWSRNLNRVASRSPNSSARDAWATIKNRVVSGGFVVAKLFYFTEKNRRRWSCSVFLRTSLCQGQYGFRIWWVVVTFLQILHAYAVFVLNLTILDICICIMINL